MSAFPLPPSLARVLLFAADHSETLVPVIKVLAMLSVEQLFVRPADKRRQAVADRAHALLKHLGGDDFCTLLFIFDAVQVRVFKLKEKKKKKKKK